MKQWSVQKFNGTDISIKQMKAKTLNNRVTKQETNT